MNADKHREQHKMSNENIIRRLDSREFLDKLYGFCYGRVSDSHTAQDLCHEIILRAMQTPDDRQIGNAAAYIRTIAHNVYADFCERRRQSAERCANDLSFDDERSEAATVAQADPIEEFIEREEDNRRLKIILRKIAFLSKIYRDVTVMYYIDGLSVAETARRLGISENAVKARLFSARNQLKEEKIHMSNNSMQENLTLKQVDISYAGMGSPWGNDPVVHANRLLSKNLIYLCRDKAHSAKELSERLNVPLVFIEEEIEIQTSGSNGVYGTLRKVGDKYISNILLIKNSELETCFAAYTKYLPDIVGAIKSGTEKNREKILSFPYLSKQNDPRFILWALINNMVGKFVNIAVYLSKNKYFADVKIAERPFSAWGYVSKDGERQFNDFYGNDGRRSSPTDGSNDIGKYKSVYVQCMYGHRIKRQFSCNDPIETDPICRMAFRAIGGLAVNGLTEREKEVAAKAVETGYLRNDGGVLSPKVVVIDDENRDKFFNLIDISEPLMTTAEKLAAELAVLIKKYVPAHLMSDYQIFINSTGTRILHETIEACIAADLLTMPPDRLCAEGVLMTVKR